MSPAAPVACLDRISYWYPGAERPSLAGVSLALEPGLTLVAGSSGGGKSTLLRLLNGLVPQFHGGRIAGSAVVAGLDPLRDPIRDLARRVGLVFQDPEAQAVYGTVEREVAFGLENLGLSRPEMVERVGEALDTLGLGELRDRRLATLSGGERQRVQLAAVLALRPALIALDEPTSQLDTEGAAAVAAACLRLAAAGQTLVVAEHRLDALLPGADRLLLVEDGVAAGPARPAALAGRLTSPPAVVELGRALGWSPLPLSVEAARARRAAVLPSLAAGAWPATMMSAAGAWPATMMRAAATSPSWELRSVSAAPDPRAPAVVEGVDLAGHPGEALVLMGANGSGKTTLLRTIAGLLPVRAGSVDRTPGRTAYLPQNPAALLHLPTVRAEVELTIRRAGTGASADAMLAAFGLETLAGRYPRDLSAGQRQRAAIAAILAGSPSLALLDEPTRGMDLTARRELTAAIRALCERGGSVVLATHDAELAAEAGDRVVVLLDGRAVELGAPEQALGGGSPFATQIGRLFPDGPVTVEGALAALARDPYPPTADGPVAPRQPPGAPAPAVPPAPAAPPVPSASRATAAPRPATEGPLR